MPNLSDYVSLLERLQSQNLTIDAQRCIIVRNRNASCRLCAQACTSNCIHLKGNDLAVDSTKCIGCGACATACPTGVIEPRLPDDRELAHRAATAMRTADGIVVFACEEFLQAAAGHFDPDAVVGVTCLGRIDESLITSLVGAGATDIRMVQGSCETCVHRNAAWIAQVVCASAGALLAAWGSNARVRLSQRLPEACRLPGKAPYDHDRREFLVAMTGRVKGTVHECIEFSIDQMLDHGGQRCPSPIHVTEDGTLPHHIPRRRRLLLDGLKTLGNPHDVLVKGRLWGHVVIDTNRCSACRMCAVFCPTGALSKYESGNETGVTHAPGLCVKCRCCENLCPHHALHLVDEVFAVEVHAGFTERYPMRDIASEKGGPDAIRNSMKKLIHSSYLWG